MGSMAANTLLLLQAPRGECRLNWEERPLPLKAPTSPSKPAKLHHLNLPNRGWPPTREPSVQMPETLGHISHSNPTISEFIIVVNKDHGKKLGAGGDSGCLIGTKLQINIRIRF